MLWLNLILFIVSAIVLLVSSNWLVKSLSKIAASLRMQEFTVGFAIMAIATSLPELFVGISAGLHKNTALSLGNVIGSNIVDLTLIAGIGILLTRGYAIKTTETRKDALFMVGFAFLPLLLMLLGKEISKGDGAVLLLAFAAYMIRIIKKRKEFPKKIQQNFSKKEIILSAAFFIISLLLLLFSADKMVEYGTALSLDLLLPPILIGLFLIALATSLPELAFETTALLKGRSEMALGDLIGSVVTNSSLVLGVTAVIHPISADFFLTITSGFFMLLVSFLFATFVATKRLTWKEGVSLIMLYVFFVILEFFAK